MTRKRERARLENLEILIREAGSAARLAELANTSASYLSQVRHQLTSRSGSQRALGDVLADKLERAMGKPHGWMDEQHHYVREPEPPGPYGSSWAGADLYPLITWAQACTRASPGTRSEQPSRETEFACPIDCSPDTFVLEVRGQSMEPKFHDGDLLFVDPNVAADDGRYVVVRFADAREATLRQLIVEGDRSYLKALNPDWPQRIIEIDEHTTICGVVVFAGAVL